MRIYLRYLKSERFSAMMFALFLWGCAYIMVVVYPSITKIQMAREYMEALPSFMKAIVGEEIMDFTTLEGFLTYEYFNTTWLFVMGIFSCLFAGSLVTEETEKKTLEILFSTGVTRTEFLVSKFAGFLSLLVFLAAVSFLGICLGEWEIGEKIDKRLMAYIFLNGTICLATIGSIGLLLSCLFNGQRRACSLTIVLFLSLYVFNLITILLEQYPSLKYLSLFNYYDASKIFRRQAICWPDIAIMLAVFSLMSGASIFTFRRKEIYL